MRTKKQVKNKKKRHKSKKRIIIFHSHELKEAVGSKVYFRWGGISSNKKSKYPARKFIIQDLITGETLIILSVAGRSLMERCFENEGIYIIGVRKQEKTDMYKAESLKPNMINKVKEDYPELFI